MVGTVSSEGVDSCIKVAGKTLLHNIVQTAIEAGRATSDSFDTNGCRLALKRAAGLVFVGTTGFQANSAASACGRSAKGEGGEQRTKGQRVRVDLGKLGEGRTINSPSDLPVNSHGHVEGLVAWSP